MTTQEKKKKETPRQEVLMAKDKLIMLKQMYVLRSYSGFEEVMRHAIIKELNRLNIPYTNFNGNIVGINHPGRPLMSAHMDMVNTERYKLKGEEYYIENPVFTIDNNTNIRLYRDSDRKNQTSLGADDKNGIWVILNLLSEGVPINFLFCHGEEVGAIGSNQVVTDEDLGPMIESCSYGIIIDRRNAHDIIGYDNKYCIALDDKIQHFSDVSGYKYECAKGSCSDADNVSKVLECVNISCGYYEAHTSTEYTNLNQLQNTLNFIRHMVTNFKYESVSPKRMQTFKSCKNPYAASVIIIDKEESEAEKKKNQRWQKPRGALNTADTTTETKKPGSVTTRHNFYGNSHLIDDDTITGSEFDYTVELRAEEDMSTEDYYDIVTSARCPNCTCRIYLLGTELLEMEGDGYSLHDTIYEIGGECSGCGTFTSMGDITGGRV